MTAGAKLRVVLKAVEGVVRTRRAQGEAFAPEIVVVGTSATLISAAGRRLKIRLYNDAGANIVYLGDDSVTPATGWPLRSKGEWEEECTAGAIYGVVAAGTANVYMLEY
jgi:hypothetical protein